IILECIRSPKITTNKFASYMKKIRLPLVISPLLSAIIFVLLSGSANTAKAQQSNLLDTLITTKEVVVSSVRTPQTAATTGRNITIIPARVIQEMPVHTTDELLRYVPGVEVQSRGAFGTQSDFSIRGSTFSQILVMVDGMRLNDPLAAHFNSNIPVAPSEIKRIEVLHGPAAAQYGADAVGGVINIITNNFSKPTSKQHTDANIKVGYGQYRLKTGRAGFSHFGHNYRIGGGGMWYHSPGQTLDDDYKSRFGIGTLSLSGGFQLGQGWDLAIRSAYDERDYNARYFYTASPADNATSHIRAWWNQLQLTQQSKNRQTTIKTSFKHNIGNYVFNANTPANHHITELLNLQVYQNWQLSPQWSWTYGLQGNHRFINSNDRGRHSDWHYAGFSMLQWKPVDPLTLTGSLRLDHDQSYGTELMPQFSASYNTGHWIFRLSGGRSIRSASYTERYISTNTEEQLAEGRNLGNPHLQAERSWSGEAGIDFLATSHLRLSATGFLRSSTNLIDYLLKNSSQISNNENLKPNTNYLYSENLNTIQTYGLETNLLFQYKLNSRWK